MLSPLVYLNGRFLPQGEAHLPLNDAGFIFGATVTDLCRTFRHRLFRLADHLTRFRRSCTIARVPQPLPDLELTKLAEELVAHNAELLPPEGDLALVLFATPGPIGYYLGEPGGPGDGPLTLGLHTFPLPFSRYAHLFREGARLVVPTIRHVPAACVDPRVKQRSRLPWWLAEQEARQADPAATALLLDAAGHVTETGAANFLVVRDGTVLTPPRSTVLGGISLLTVEELGGELGISFAERPLRVDDCLAAEEAMLASTPYCLAGVRFLNGFPLPWPGPVFQRLLAAWSGRVGLDIARQILAAP
jgi:branched-subunit amino acid aminotransferase/4-amino-4-deoxychorismate lyase